MNRKDFQNILTTIPFFHNDGFCRVNSKIVFRTWMKREVFQEMAMEGVPDQVRWAGVGIENTVISFSPDFPEKKGRDELRE